MKVVIKNMRNILGKRWRHGVLGLLTVSLMWFNNCGKVYEPKLVSASCNQTKLVSPDELDKLIHEAHMLSESTQRIRCPGFFAVLKDDDSSPVAQVRAKLATNDCNQGGPPVDPIPPSPDEIKDRIIKELLPRANPQNIRNWVVKMSDNSLWPTRYHLSANNNAVSAWIQQEFQKLAAGRADVKVTLVSHQNTPQKSVEVLIGGTGANKSKFVVLGGHQDSINGQGSRNNPEAIAPGADDNASGVASLLEAFRIMMDGNYYPDATIAFYTYAAEEVGLVGSQEIARSYANASKSVLGVMQIDMAMYSSRGKPNILFINDFTSSALTKLASDLAKNYLGLTVNSMTCGYACSDHASWTKYGYPSFMPAEDDVEASIDRIHTANDLADSPMKEDYATKFSQLAVAFAVSIAGSK
ncbi:MAG: M20/M25/M40 family metallo-hydrolase [Bdellovibrionales bacterium]|nr:M20/M25/M40 family metallo-hydrolase [Bdellovibrionales bacterium]